MPKKGFESLIFTVIMAGAMVYGMVVYNIALREGGFGTETLLKALGELPVMVPIAVALEILVVGPLAAKIVFGVMTPGENPRGIIMFMSLCICTFMCPAMSFFATLLFNPAPSVSAWASCVIMNYPAALILQLCICGPLVRFAFTSGKALLVKETPLS